MKKTLIISFAAAALLAGQVLSAGETSRKYPSGGNWFAEGGIGLNAVYNNRHFGGPGLALDLAVGKWLSPDVALRAGVHGLFNSPVKSDTKWLTGEGRFMQASVDADVLWDPFSTFMGYDSGRLYSLQPYGRFALLSVGKNKPENFELGAGAGLKNVFRLGEDVACHLDISALVSREQAFLPSGHFIVFPAATFGVTFRFGKQGFPKKEVVTKIQECDHLPQIHNLLEQIQQLKNAPADTVKVIEYVENKPELKKENLEIGSVILFFDLGKDVLSVEERARLEAFAKSEALNDAEIIITGSADSATGSAETNKAISQRRATHVYELLLNRFGVEKSRVKIEAIGDTANVGSPEENRCVTVTASRVLK